MHKIKRKILEFPLLSVFLLIAIFLLLPVAGNSVLSLFFDASSNAIAPLFTPQVQYWETDIERWSASQDIDPNLMATIMQIESCGHPDIASSAGAQGLFQVMPFHFDAGENMIDPDTNARRSANFIRECTVHANGDIGLTLACYNGGPSVTRRAFHTWPHETQRYYVWGLGIYQDAVNFADQSDTLDQWLLAGGLNLCNLASSALRQR